MKKILVVEDSATMRSLIGSIVEELTEVEVVEAGNGFEALKALPTASFDLILVDINIPAINGLEVISFVKQHPEYRKIPVIIISTARSEEDIRRGLALGARDYITKPFDLEMVRTAVQKALGES